MGCQAGWREIARISARGIPHQRAPVAYGHRMGRPKLYAEPRVATAIRLPLSVRDELQHAAAERDVSVNFLVTRAVSDFLRRLPPVDDSLRDDADRGRRRRTSSKTAS